MLDTAERPPVTEVELAPVGRSARTDDNQPANAGKLDETETAGVTPEPPTPAATLSAAPVLPLSVRVCIFLVAAAAAVLSFSSLRDLAVQTEYLSRIAWLFPISLDAAAGVAMVVWMRSPDWKVAAHARNLTWASIVLSVACNGIQHGLVAAGIVVPWQVAVGVSTIPPVMFGAVVHLVVLTGGRHRWGGTAQVDLDATPVKRDQAGAVVRDEVPAPTPPTGTATTSTNDPGDDTQPSQEATTAGLRSVPSLPREEEPPPPGDEQRKCANPSCQKLLPRDSHPSRRTCGSPCRQAAARHRKQEVTA